MLVSLSRRIKPPSTSQLYSGTGNHRGWCEVAGWRRMEALDRDEIKLGVNGHNVKDVSNIIKGKRTKRQRPQSPIHFPITATHSTSSHHPIPSPATSSEFPAGGSATTTTTDEDEDTAMCLILLSKGFSSQSQQEKPPKIEEHEFSVNKFSSKKYLQPPTAAANGTAAAVCVYECKTCNRTFPSFQALGGHRTSHKRPKIAINLGEKKPPLMAFSDEEPPPPSPESSIKSIPSSSSSLSLQSNTIPLFKNPINKSPKLHECSICGAEFISGQALGGHMRRHRLPTATATTTSATTLSLLPNSPIETEIDSEKMSRNDGFCLDLNLPAPDDYDHHQRDSKFAFASKQELPPSLVMSTRPTLVDCHY